MEQINSLASNNPVTKTGYISRTVFQLILSWQQLQLRGWDIVSVAALGISPHVHQL